jgi:PAS domain S-box-containing protein
MKKKEPVTNIVPFPNFDNQKKCLLLSSYPLLDKTGNITKIIEYAKDVTEINDMKEAVKRIEDQYRLLADNITDVVYTIDMNQNFTYVSPSAEDFIGYSLDELYTIDFKDILTPESYQLQSELMKEKIAKHGQLNKSDKIEVKFVRKTGEEFWGEIHVGFITNKKNEPIGIIGSARDIDRRKKAELELSYNYKKLNRKSDLRVEQIQRLLTQRDDFVIQLGHDLKTRLIPIVSLLPIIEKKETDPEPKELINTVSKASDSLTHLVKRMSRFMQIDSSQIQLQLEKFKLHSTVNHVIDYLTDNPEKINNINFISNIDENLEIKADKKLLEEIFGNLLMNSVKYSPYGGTITINAKKENLGIVISVQDQGIGLTLEQMNRIFELFSLVIG